MLLSHHLMSGPQFSSHPKYSGPCLSGSGGAGGAGGAGGEGGGGGGVGGEGGVGPGGAGGKGGPGGVGAGAGGTLLQSAFPLHFVLKSALQNPPVPPDGYPPQLDLSPHLLQQHDEAPDASVRARANEVTTNLNAIDPIEMLITKMHDAIKL